MATTTEPDMTDEYLYQVFQDLCSIARGGGRIGWQELDERTWIALWERLPSRHAQCMSCDWVAWMPLLGQLDKDVNEIGDLRDLWDPSLDPASCCGNADWADVDNKFWGDRRPYKAQADDAMQTDNLADGCGESDDKDAGDEKSDDDGEDDDEDEEDDDDDDDDKVMSQSSEDSLSLNRSRDYDIQSRPYSAGVGLEFFHTIKGKGCVSCNDLPPTIPGLMKLPQPSADENDTDRAREQRSLAVLNEARWPPAHAPGTFRATCQKRPVGYGVGSKRITDWGHRPWARLFIHENPICAWLRADIVNPKGWMVYEAQVRELMHFRLWQYRVRGLPVPEELRDLDDAVLPPEYYHKFPKGYLRYGSIPLL
ncbi:hypothetical protein F5883DRAFT_647063 [Diaporthe sp. PMI_573]|nr:hypothetical protein F5883DRAFT_647063 [Diaporthaceae sp. PMI_573]